MPDEGKRRRRRRVAASASAAEPPPNSSAGGAAEPAGPQPPIPSSSQPLPQSKPSKPKRLNPGHSRTARAYIASATSRDAHALHVAAFSQCDPAEIAACPECQRVARSQAHLQSIKLRALARHGAGTRVAALKRGGGSGVTPPVPGGGTHSAVAWRLVRRRPRPSVLGPHREQDAEGMKRRKEEEERRRDRVREKLGEARREARGRGEVMRRTLVKLGVMEERRGGGSGTQQEVRDDRNAGGDASEPQAEAAVDAGAGRASPAPAVLDINNLPPPEIDPALEAMDAAGSIELLPDSDSSVARVSGELDAEPEQASGALDAEPEEAAEEASADAATTEEAAPATDEGASRQPDTLDTAVARDFDAVAAARARAKGKARAPPPDEDVIMTPAERTKMGWEMRKRDARIAEGVAAYMAQKARTRARGPVSILKKPRTTSGEAAEGPSSSNTSAGPSTSSATRKSVAFAPLARVYTLPPKPQKLDYPHPELYKAVAAYAAQFYELQGALELKEPKPQKGRRDTVWERAKRRELEAAGVWDAKAIAEAKAAKKKGKEKEKTREKEKEKEKEKEERGPYINRGMEEAFDGTALLHLSILMEEYMAHQMREAGWTKAEKKPAGDAEAAPPAQRLRVGVVPRDLRRPQRVYFGGVDGGAQDDDLAQAEAMVRAMRKVRFADTGTRAPGKKAKAKEPTPEIPTIVLDDSSDEERAPPTQRTITHGNGSEESEDEGMDDDLIALDEDESD